MPQAKKRLGKTLDLAGQIEADIRARNLKEGDRYYNTVEAAKMLGVDTGTVNRALQLLAKKNVIMRSQRKGTFIAAGPTAEDRPVLQQVHLMVGDSYPRMEGWFNHDVMLALQGELPGVRMQLHSVPSEDETDYIQKVTREALKSPFPEGFVLVRASLTMQRMMAASGLPVALFGHPYASLPELPFVDRDQKQIGRLLAQHVLEQGHRRIAIFMRQRVLRGDHLLMEGAREVAGEAELRADGFSIHCLHQDAVEIKDSVLSVIQDQKNLPGIIVRSPTMAEVILKTIRAAGMKPQKEVSVVVSDYFGSAQPPFPHICTQNGTDDQATRLGRLIWRVACGKTIDPHGHLVPVRLEIPEGISLGAERGNGNVSKRKGKG
ncbi:MAG: substrate-binding domain-containing protein [Planctomycetota bacterium]|nr:substrate-binding domain-containing protein [Planctomycetota bacterium]